MMWDTSWEKGAIAQNEQILLLPQYFDSAKKETSQNKQILLLPQMFLIFHALNTFAAYTTMNLFCQEYGNSTNE